MTKAVIPGTFDPVTSGHMDVIERATAIFDELVVGVAVSEMKNERGPLFDLNERIEFLRVATAHVPQVSVAPFSKLLVDFVREQGATAIVKGLRAMTDFEHEFQMAALNWRLDRRVETMFIMSAPDYMYLSSSAVKEIAVHGGDLTGLVPPVVQAALRKRFIA
ncbi:MAG: pantetheine-phosphate adenylyltransferase [Actinomycetes bacterium]|jgi:pantetheine-phosphate adenylyltransferase|nr:pantetheine-phosphate adenylyltransferase [Actinomycetes bacterium]